MATHMPRTQPWSEYRRTLAPLENRYELSQATGDESLVDDIYLYTGLTNVLKRLQVGLFRAETTNGLQYHLVQLGQVVPDCDRIILWRATGNFFSRAWYTADEQSVAWPDNGDLLSHLQNEDHLRAMRNTLNAADEPIAQDVYWEAYKLTPERGNTWSALVRGLQKLKEQGHDSQDIHDLLYHHDTWQARNPEAAGMPRDIVLRMHGLGEALPLIREWEYVRG
jgi:hypothetical protein